MTTRGLTGYEIEQLRRIDETWSVSPLVLAAVNRCVELHDDARLLRACLQEGRLPEDMIHRVAAATDESGYIPLTKVMLLAIDDLFTNGANR